MAGNKLQDTAAAFVALHDAIAAKLPGLNRPLLVGIRRGGTVVAEQLAGDFAAFDVALGAVSTGFHRDDAATNVPRSGGVPNEMPNDVNGRDVILVDDIVETGRSVRAAIECILEYGRPRHIFLAVLFDRGGRELPIQPDFCGGMLGEAVLSAQERLRIARDEHGSLVATLEPRGS